MRRGYGSDISALLALWWAAHAANATEAGPTPPRRSGPAAGRTSALIGLRGWHGCHIDAAGRTTWVDPVARPTAAGALTAADAEMRRAGGAPPAVTR